jgi:SRSO17 transposase
LLIRRNPTDGDMAYFTTWCPKGTSIETLVRVEGTRWRIEEGFETAKNELGLITTRHGPGTAGTGMFHW